MNPFGDPNLTEQFVWSKKHERDAELGKGSANPTHGECADSHTWDEATQECVEICPDPDEYWHAVSQMCLATASPPTAPTNMPTYDNADANCLEFDVMMGTCLMCSSGYTISSAGFCVLEDATNDPNFACEKASTEWAEANNLPGQSCKLTFRGDGTCDSYCNLFECDWDGRPASLGEGGAAPSAAPAPTPDCEVPAFEDEQICSAGCACKLLANDVCDLACNTAACGFDFGACCELGAKDFRQAFKVRISSSEGDKVEPMLDNLGEVRRR